MTIESINPATGEILERFEEPSSWELERILAAADAAFLEWRTTPFATRAEKIRKAARALRTRSETYSRTMTLEVGKPIMQAGLHNEERASTLASYEDQAA